MAQRLILEAPRSRRALIRGMDQMTALLCPTLGPTARMVAVQGFSKTNSPEVLDSAATIARRTIQIVDPWEDMGAMLVRQMAWTVFEEVGDGTATAATLCQAIVHEGERYIAAGGNAMLMKRGIERGLKTALAQLRQQARTIELPDEIARCVAGSLRNNKLSEMIGEIVEAVGSDGAILVEDARGTETTYEYIDGVRWEGGYLSYFFLHDGQDFVRLIEPRILCTDRDISTPEQILPTLEACATAGQKTLLIIAPEVSDTVIGMLIANRERGVFTEVVAAKAPGYGDQRTNILVDIATITGGKAVIQEHGGEFGEVIFEDLGTARQVWVTKNTFGILGGVGPKGAIRQRIAEVKAQLREVRDDDHLRKTLKERIGKLAGAAAIVRVAAPTQRHQEDVRARIEAAIASARAALSDGVVPGGGAAYLACVPALEQLAAELAGDEAYGARVLARAMAGPMRAIARNAGLHPSSIVYEASLHGAGWTFDTLKREWVDAWEAGIVDPLQVVTKALEVSTSAALMALTTDTLVRHKKPKTATSP